MTIVSDRPPRPPRSPARPSIRAAARLAAVAGALAAACVGPAGAQVVGQAASLEQQVFAAERAFAKTMAARDSAAFATFVSEEGVFFGQAVLRGRREVADGWRRYFEGAEAPFSWEPEQVVVLASGTLALSTGPVHGANGERTGTFNSIWRLEPDGAWRVVFDTGCSCR